MKKIILILAGIVIFLFLFSLEISCRKGVATCYLNKPTEHTTDFSKGGLSAGCAASAMEIIYSDRGNKAPKTSFGKGK